MRDTIMYTPSSIPFEQQSDLPIIPHWIREATHLVFPFEKNSHLLPCLYYTYETDKRDIIYKFHIVPGQDTLTLKDVLSFLAVSWRCSHERQKDDAKYFLVYSYLLEIISFFRNNLLPSIDFLPLLTEFLPESLRHYKYTHMRKKFEEDASILFYLGKGGITPRAHTHKHTHVLEFRNLTLIAWIHMVKHLLSFHMAKFNCTEEQRKLFKLSYDNMVYITKVVPLRPWHTHHTG